MGALGEGTELLGERLQKVAPLLYFVVRNEAPYSSLRTWGEFDELHVRVVDDLAWSDEKNSHKAVVAFSAPPPCPEGFQVVSMPTVVALERIFFHIQEIGSLQINPRKLPQFLPQAQQGLVYTLAEQFDEPIEVTRALIPELLGELATASEAPGTEIARAEAALQDNLLFECFYLARKARKAGGDNTQKAWFLELWSFSFLGLPEEALKLYEEYPERDSPDPTALMVGARYRLLLKQFNEARTIFHTLSFNPELAARAECELARSFISSGDFARAIDLATSSIGRDPQVIESYLVRGIAHRGLTYSSGEEEGLREALRDFETVALKGGFHAPEASFHAGTVFARLGDLESAERSLRQSLFQRDRFSSRDALIRVLSAAGKWQRAQEECSVLSSLAPQATKSLTEVLAQHTVSGSSEAEGEGESSLMSSDLAVASRAALRQLQRWRVPVTGAITDVMLLDDFINRFAPAGEFSQEGEFADVGSADLSLVAQVLALHVASVLVAQGLVRFEEPRGDKVAVITVPGGVRVDLESFVEERIILGAAADNVSSLESLLAEVGLQQIPTQGAYLPSWWERAEQGQIDEIMQLAEAVKDTLGGLGAVLTGGLSDLEELDRVINETFEPGGTSDKVQEFADYDKLSTFVVGTGLLVGKIIAEQLPATWFYHKQPEGISIYNVDLGRIFPISRLQHRVYLASAADVGARLGSLALGVAVAALAHKMRGADRWTPEAIRKELLALLPSLGTFDEAELSGVVETLLKMSTH